LERQVITRTISLIDGRSTGFADQHLKEQTFYCTITQTPKTHRRSINSTKINTQFLKKLTIICYLVCSPLVKKLHQSRQNHQFGQNELPSRQINGKNLPRRSYM